ncbi:cleavage stimulation factor subunit 2, partial [Lasius niger]
CSFKRELMLASGQSKEARVEVRIAKTANSKAVSFSAGREPEGLGEEGLEEEGVLKKRVLEKKELEKRVFEKRARRLGNCRARTHEPMDEWQGRLVDPASGRAA